MMMRFKEGDVLFREGDDSDFACRVVEGRVAVIKDSHGVGVVLGDIGPGDIVGEMGVIERKPRSATVRALGDVAVEVIPADRLFEALGGDPETARRVLLRLSERVRSLSEEVARLRAGPEEPAPPEPEPEPEPEQEPEPEPAPASVVAPAAAAAVERKIGQYIQSARLALGTHAVSIACEWLAGSPPVWLDTLPFRVGRAPDGVGRPLRRAGVLLVPDTPPYRVSHNHFAIVRDDRLGLVVRDLGSELGTTVNGQYLGGVFAKDWLRLPPGDSVVVAGGLQSPFVFRVHATE